MHGRGTHAARIPGADQAPSGPPGAAAGGDGPDGPGPARRRLRQLLADVYSGRGGALLIRGVPGQGTSTLLDDAAASFRGGAVLCARGTEAESRVPYSGLHALLQPVVAGRLAGALGADRSGRTSGTAERPLRRVRGPSRGGPRSSPRPGSAPIARPSPSPLASSASPVSPASPATPVPSWAPGRSTAPGAPLPLPPALARALELRARPAAGSGEVPAAVVELLHALAAEQPVLCCVDDAHRLDAASREALGFAARRAGAGPHPVVMLIGLPRDRPEDPLFAGLPSLMLPELDDAAAGALLDELLPRSTDPAVREALLQEGQGNPGLLTDLAAGLTGPQLAGAAPLPRPLPADGPRLRSCTERLRELPRDTRMLLLLAAATAEMDGPADTGLLCRAASRAGVDPDRLAVAAAAGLVRTEGDTVSFAHPLLRRAVHTSESPARRRAAHRLLAEALAEAPAGEPCGAHDEPHRRLRWLRHRAAAGVGPDRPLADALAAEAERVGSAEPYHRLGAAEALVTAASLTDDGQARTMRLTEAARYTWSAGRPHRARALLDAACAVPAGEAARGRAELLRGILELRCGVVTDAREVLLHAARLLGPHHAADAREALLYAAEACGALGDTTGYRTVLERIPELGAPAERGLLGAFATGMAAVMRNRFQDARARLRRVVSLAAREEDPQRLVRAGVAALVLGEVAAARDVTTRAVAAARSHGPAVLVPQALEHLVYSELRSGRYDRAREHARQGLELAQRTGQCNSAAHFHAALAMLAAVEGEAARCAAHARAAGERAGPHGLGIAGTLAQWALARCDLGLGRPREAATRLQPLVRTDALTGSGQGHFALRMLAVPCFVEAAVLSGDPDAARPAVRDFVHWAANTADPLAPAQLARCRALLAGDPREAADLFDRALAEHDGAEDDYERARTRLMYGMALRRCRRPAAARDVLREALISFERCGARVWAEQARAELRATGETAGREVPAALAALTPQQLRIARCVAQGATNREVAVRLSVSPRTVDHHLRNVFAALGIRSRVELTRLMAAADG